MAAHEHREITVIIIMKGIPRDENIRNEQKLTCKRILHVLTVISYTGPCSFYNAACVYPWVSGTLVKHTPHCVDQSSQ